MDGPIVYLYRQFKCFIRSLIFSSETRWRLISLTVDRVGLVNLSVEQGCLGGGGGDW